MERTLALEAVKLVGKTVLLKGWLNSVRSHGKLVFFDLRDRSGLVQVVAQNLTTNLKQESVVAVTGEVKERPEKLINPNLATGKVEVAADKVEVITTAGELPLPVDGDGHDIDESVRLKYRYLDLRRPRMNRNLRLRAKAVKFIRDFLTERDFVEVETPVLTKTTPEGARDFLVPSRLKPGKFYALPQSPQQYKQLLMVAGLERYFQIARCFRDEDPRADRELEFTQLDVEMSFIDEADVMALNEALLIDLAGHVMPHLKISRLPFPHLTYAQAMERHGSAKPDLRYALELGDLAPVVATSGFRVFAETIAGGGRVKAIAAPALFTRKEIDG